MKSGQLGLESNFRYGKETCEEESRRRKCNKRRLEWLGELSADTEASTRVYSRVDCTVAPITTASCKCGGLGRGSHVARLNFKTSRVGVYKFLLLIVGRGRLSHVAISFYALSLLFGSCRLSEFILAGPLYCMGFELNTIEVNKFQCHRSCPGWKWFSFD